MLMHALVRPTSPSTSSFSPYSPPIRWPERTPANMDIIDRAVQNQDQLEKLRWNNQFVTLMSKLLDYSQKHASHYRHHLEHPVFDNFPKLLSGSMSLEDYFCIPADASYTQPTEWVLDDICKENPFVYETTSWWGEPRHYLQGQEVRQLSEIAGFSWFWDTHEITLETIKVLATALSLPFDHTVLKTEQNDEKAAFAARKFVLASDLQQLNADEPFLNSIRLLFKYCHHSMANLINGHATLSEACADNNNDEAFKLIAFQIGQKNSSAIALNDQGYLEGPGVEILRQLCQFTIGTYHCVDKLIGLKDSLNIENRDRENYVNDTLPIEIPDFDLSTINSSSLDLSNIDFT